jgi:hypothetical protein
MNRKPRTPPHRPVVPTPPVPEFEKPFYFLVFGAVASSVMAVGIVHALIRLPARGSVLMYAFWMGFVVLSAWMARQYTRAAVARVRKWRGR